MADNVGVYEGLFILDANRLARDRDSLPGEVEKMIESTGGQIEVSRLWEERRLAYPIRGQRKGAYWITYFRMTTAGIADLTRQCEINDGVLRQLFVRLPEKLVGTILDHAKGIGAAQEPEAAAEAGAAGTSENGKPAEPAVPVAAPAAAE